MGASTIDCQINLCVCVCFFFFFYRNKVRTERKVNPQHLRAQHQLKVDSIQLHLQQLADSVTNAVKSRLPQQYLRLRAKTAKEGKDTKNTAANAAEAGSGAGEEESGVLGLKREVREESASRQCNPALCKEKVVLVDGYIRD